MSFDKVNPKFHPNGEPKPFYGNTIISFVQQDSPFWQALNKIRDELKNLEFSHKLAFMPPESFHMTIIGTVFENHRKSRIQHCELRSYVYILSGQKFVKNAKNGQFWRVLKT